MKTKIETGTFRFVMFHGDRIVCDRIWKKDEKIRPNKFELELEFDEVVRIVDLMLNAGYEENETIHTYTVMYEDFQTKLQKEIQIKKRPWKDLYHLDIRPRLPEIRDRLRYGLMYYL